MTVFASRIDPSSESFRQNHADMLALVADVAALQAQKDRLVAYYDRQSEALYTTGRMLDQGIIDPRDTRKVIGFALDTCAEAPARTVKPNSFGVARM